jgi:uncharacterized protein
MNSLFKLFNVGDSVYIFCADDFEILKLPTHESIEKSINEIMKFKAKSISSQNEKEDIRDDIFGNNTINKIAIDIATNCNLNCSYCYISASSKPRKSLPMEGFTEIINFLKKGKERTLTFYFTGAGEPTLNFQLIKQIPDICKENGFDNCTFDITTNGTILTEEMINFFKQNKFILNISLDGNERFHNKNRKYHDGRGSFKDVFHNIQLLKKNNIDFTCKTVVLTDNNELSELFSFFEENKIHFDFNIATNSIDKNYLPDVGNLNTYSEQLDIVFNTYRELIEKNHVIFADKLISDMKRIHLGEIRLEGCKGSKEAIFIDIDGNIFPCSYHTESKNLSIGHINTGVEYDRIIHNQWYAKPVDHYSSCRNCWMKYLCSGSCFAIKWLENGNTNDPYEYLCKAYDIYWNALIKLYIQIHPTITNGNNINFSNWDS